MYGVQCLPALTERYKVSLMIQVTSIDLINQSIATELASYKMKVEAKMQLKATLASSKIKGARL